MSVTMDVRELPARLGEALAIVSSGGEVTLIEGATVRARLVPDATPLPRRPGLHTNAIQTAPDFDAPLPDDFWAGQP